MASYFNSAGSKVIVVEMLDKIAGNTDDEISSILLENYIKKGIEFKLGCKVTSINANNIEFIEKGKLQTISADKVLISVGRRPVTQGFGLENIKYLYGARCNKNR